MLAKKAVSFFLIRSRFLFKLLVGNGHGVVGATGNLPAEALGGAHCNLLEGADAECFGRNNDSLCRPAVLLDVPGGGVDSESLAKLNGVLSGAEGEGLEGIGGLGTDFLENVDVGHLWLL